ncbi:MAG: formate dehydrogenase subunit delta [Chelatococcus sp.]|uniref:formate dehydrogenase subunit delta n=1 Tax=Chelatococcus sp. TaxID=1953771 RepID=UPI0025C59E23|nr:formate dehydrogenase subunit delta [Chelatococcus sp.]MBX3540650.1 formate dehydrogenase subunit delta [Chelatococcus sp.]
MSPDTLVRMANQIAAFFKAQGAETAPAAIAEHLRLFWEPRMRNAIIELEGNGAATALDPLAAAAVRMLKPVDAAGS